MRPQQEREAADFRALHEGDAFIIPNPWDAGSARVLEAGLRSGEEIRAVCEATSKPVNVLAHAGLSMDEIAGAGAQRVSVGGAPTWVAVRAMAAAAEQVRDTGDFSVLGPGPVKEWLGGG